MTTLTVLVPHYGAAERTTLLVDALLRQSRPPDEVVVVDDHSPIPFRDDRVRVHRRASNGGFGSAVNSGAARARGDLLLILNSDVDIPHHFLRDLLAASAPLQPAVVSPRVVTEDGHDEWVGRHFPRTHHQVIEWLTPLARHRERLHEWVGHDTSAVGRTASVDWVAGIAMLIPRDSFESVGGFDERFYMNAEEVDLQLRLRSRGLPAYVVDSPTLRHEGGASSDPLLRRTWLVESRLRYADKWGGLWVLRAGLTAATLVNAVANLARRIAGRPVAPLSIAREELRLAWLSLSPRRGQRSGGRSSRDPSR